MTHSEARAKWPDAHLWWHTEARCWDRSPRGAEHYDDRPPVKVIVPQPVPDNVAAADQAVPGVHTTVYYPTLEINAWPVTVLPMGRSDMSTWPLLLDVDRPTKFDNWRDRIWGAWK